eukprot:2669770-Pyramimonas_sp.AAC.1
MIKPHGGPSASPYRGRRQLSASVGVHASAPFEKRRRHGASVASTGVPHFGGRRGFGRWRGWAGPLGLVMAANPLQSTPSLSRTMEPADQRC